MATYTHESYKKCKSPMSYTKWAFITSILVKLQK